MLAMTEEPDNLTLQHLRQIRTEMHEGFAKLTTEQALTSHKIGTLEHRRVGWNRRKGIRKPGGV